MDVGLFASLVVRIKAPRTLLTAGALRRHLFDPLKEFQMKRDDRPTKAQRAAADLWLIRRDGTATEADEVSFRHWLTADHRHHLAYREAAMIWQHLEEPAIRLAAQDSHRSKTTVQRRRQMGWWPALPAAIAAACVVWFVNPSMVENWRADIVTARGQMVSRDLPDGSRLNIGADTALDVDFKDGRRRVVLRRGQAFFDVKPDQTAFTVDSGAGEIRVLGTAFNVDRTADGVEVTVQRGLVSVAGQDRETTVKLSANQHVLVSGGKLGAVETGDTDTRLAWISGRLVFDRVPLQRVVEALQRQTQSRIVVRGRFSDLLVSGTFPTTNVDESLSAIAGMIDGNVAQVTPWVTVIY
jgi:transmembrane sensor